MLSLTTLIENDNLDEHRIKEYSRYIKIVAKELDDFTRKLNEVYNEKKTEISGS